MPAFNTIGSRPPGSIGGGVVPGTYISGGVGILVVDGFGGVIEGISPFQYETIVRENHLAYMPSLFENTLVREVNVTFTNAALKQSTVVREIHRSFASLDVIW